MGVGVKVAEEHDFIIEVKGILEGERVVDSNFLLLFFLFVVAVLEGIQLKELMIKCTSLNGT